MVETKRDKNNIMLVILRLCFLLRDTINEKNKPHVKYFMDSPTVKAAINNNKPADLSKLIEIFIEKSFSHVEKFGSIFSNINHPKTKSSLMSSIFINNGFSFSNPFARQLIMIQLIVWSVVSSESFNSITLILLNFWKKKIEVNEFDQNELWMWLHNLNTCILSTTKHVYERYEPDIESQNPLCQLLLLEASILHNSRPFIDFGIFFSYKLADDIRALTDTKKSQKIQWSKMTQKFIEYLHQENAPYSAKNDASKILNLKSIREWGKPEIPTNEIALTMDGFIKKCFVEKKISTEQLNQSLELSVVETTPMTLPAKMAMATHKFVQLNQSLEPSVVETTQMTLPAKMSMATHKSLQNNVTSLMKLMEKYNISSWLNKIWKLKLQDINKNKQMFSTMKSSYLSCCKKFAETELPEGDSTVRNYTIRMTNFSALLVFDFNQTTDSRVTLDYKNVLAHVLRHCLHESMSNTKFSWMKFFNLLIPQQAFSKMSNPNLMSLAMYSRKCVTSMSIVEPLSMKVEFQFYFQSNYFFDKDIMNEKALIERKTLNRGGKRVRDKSESFHTESDNTPRRSNRVRDESESYHTEYNLSPRRSNRKKMSTKETMTSIDPLNLNQKLSNNPMTSKDSTNLKRNNLPERQELNNTIDNPESNNRKPSSSDWVKSKTHGNLLTPTSLQCASPSKKKQNKKQKFSKG